MPFPAKTTQEAILKAAIELVEQEGWAALSMRRLGQLLGVQASSLYHHFPDRAALEAALGRLATQTLWNRLSRAGVRGKLKPLANAYLEFARENPALYHLVAGVPSAGDESPEAKAVWKLLLEVVEDDTAAAVAVWSFLHGYATLDAAGKFGKSGPRGGLARGLTALATGLRAKEHIL